MGKKIVKRLAALALCAAVTCGTALAANTVYRTITVTYSGIKLVIDGIEITPKDANGTVVEPFIYNGTTYLPVRAVGNAIGKQVTWDGNTQTVYLGDDLGKSVYLMDVCPPYEEFNCSHKNTSFSMAGESYNHGFSLFTAGYVYVNLNGNYNTLEFDLGHIDGAYMDEAIFEIYLDGRLVRTITAEPDSMVQHYTIDLNKSLQLKIMEVGGSYGIRYGLANILLS